MVLAAVLRVRGESSLFECPFPKLDLKVPDDEARLASIFYKAKRTKIGTHCAEDSGDQPGPIGRLRNDKAPAREAFVYEMMRQLDMPSRRARPVLVTYTDSSGEVDNGGWTIERRAFLFDHAQNVAKRHGGVLRDKEAEWNQEDASLVDRELAARIYFLEALVGNDDWRLPMFQDDFYNRLHNTRVITMDDGTHVPFADDFDLASAVTGWSRVREEELSDIYPTESLFFRQAAFLLLRAREQLFTETELADAVAFFVAAEPDLRALLAAYPMDEEGRRNFSAHFDAFYGVLDREYRKDSKSHRP